MHGNRLQSRHTCTVWQAIGQVYKRVLPSFLRARQFAVCVQGVTVSQKERCLHLGAFARAQSGCSLPAQRSSHLCSSSTSCSRRKLSRTACRRVRHTPNQRPYLAPSSASWGARTSRCRTTVNWWAPSFAVEAGACPAPYAPR